MVQFRRGRKTPWMVQVRDFDGKLQTRSFATKAMAEEFVEKETRKRQAVRAGIRAPREKTLLHDFAADWLRRRVKDHPITTTSREEARLRRIWLPILGKHPIDYITTAQVLEILDKLQEGIEIVDEATGIAKRQAPISPATRNRHRAMLHTIFQSALMRDKVDRNPIARIELVEERPVRKKHVVKDMAQLERYLDALYRRKPAYGLLGEIMLFTGARVGQAIGLQYWDLDERAQTVTFRRIEERDGGAKIVERLKDQGDTSGEDGGLTVPLFPRLAQRIAAHRARSPYNRPTDFICARDDGSWTRYDAFKVANRLALEEAGLPANATPHTLRASFATLAKQAGYTRTELMEILGHSSEAVTARYDKKDVSHLVQRGKKLGFGAATKLRRVK